MVVAFGSESGSCFISFLWFNQFISGIDYYTRHEVVGSLRVYFIDGFCIGFILFIVFWNITRAVFLQLLNISKERIAFCAQVDRTRGEISAASPITLQSQCKHEPKEPILPYGQSWPTRQGVHLK